jgi:hypothetical protein
VSGRDWARLRRRDIIRRNGFEDIKGELPFIPSLPSPGFKRRSLSKAELRAQAADALARSTVPIRRLPPTRR